MGTDSFSRENRSEIMSHIKSKNTKPEYVVRSALHKMGYRFRLHRRDLPGTPDIILPKYRIAIFVHGCFWHQHPGCKRATKPKQNAAYWEKKLTRNIERDQKAQQALREMGWRVIVVWECRIDKEIEALLAELLAEYIPSYTFIK